MSPLFFCVLSRIRTCHDAMVQVLVLLVPVLPLLQQPLGVGVLLQCLTGLQIAAGQHPHALAHILHDAHDLGRPLLKVVAEALVGDNAARGFLQRHGGGVLRAAFQKADNAEEAVVLYLGQQTLGGLVVIHIQGHLSPQNIVHGRHIVALLIDDLALFEDLFSRFGMIRHRYRRLSLSDTEQRIRTSYPHKRSASLRHSCPYRCS